VVLRDGTRICAKCGRAVGPPKTNLPFIDWVRNVYPHLVHYLGPIWGGVVAGVLFIVLFVLFVIFVIVKTFLLQ
jgi:hypothetical protein